MEEQEGLEGLEPEVYKPDDAYGPDLPHDVVYKSPNTKNALAGISPQTILDRYEAGEEMPEIAARLGVTHQAIYKMLLSKCPEEWKEYQAAKAIAQLEDADRQLGTAADMVAVARSGTMVRSAQWKLERVLRRIYGEEKASTISGNVQINIGISR